jgi:hypothetical protein
LPHHGPFLPMAASLGHGRPLSHEMAAVVLTRSPRGPLHNHLAPSAITSPTKRFPSLVSAFCVAR